MIEAMPEVAQLPVRGREFFMDARGSDRALRVTWHHEVAVVVLSLWRHDTCTATFRLHQADVAPLINALVAGLSEAYPTSGLHAADAG